MPDRPLLSGIGGFQQLPVRVRFAGRGEEIEKAQLNPVRTGEKHRRAYKPKTVNGRLAPPVHGLNLRGRKRLSFRLPIRFAKRLECGEFSPLFLPWLKREGPKGTWRVWLGQCIAFECKAATGRRTPNAARAMLFEFNSGS